MIELYKELSQSPIYLNDEAHIYVNKTTGEFYNSVTFALGLFKEKFDEKEILSGLHRQYTTFYDWFFKQVNGNPHDYVGVLSLYLNYKGFRAPVGSHPEWGLMYKRISEYSSVDELVNEMNYLKEVNAISKHKNLYLNEDFSPMSKDSMKTMWKYLTDIANHYGSMIHLVNERYFMKMLGIDNNIFSQIATHYSSIKEILDKVALLFPHSLHSFAEYQIDVPISEFVNEMEYQFSKVPFDRGRCIVPEKMLMLNKLTGMTDVYVDVSEDTFDIGDHKTNKKYTFFSEFDKKLKAPFSHLEECEHNVYTLQTNIYTSMIERTSNKTGRNLWVTYFDRKSFSYTLHEIPRMKEEGNYIIEYYHRWMEKVKNTFKTSRLGVWFEENVPERMEDHLYRSLYEDIEKKRKDNELDDNIQKWEKHYKDFVINYVQKNKFL